jgi:hypothetical protein
MGKRRRLRKSGGGELEVNMQDVASDEAILPSVVELEVNMQDAASDEAILPSVVVADVAILLPYVAGGDEGVVESHVAALDATIMMKNIVASGATIIQQNVASDEEIGEQNGALSQLKHKDNIGIDCFRICGHQIKYRLRKLYKFLEV